MPVLSPHRSTASSGLTGTYRSAGGYTSSLEGGRSGYGGGGYSSTYVSPRISSYTSERYSTRSYADSSGRSYYSRAGSITEDGYTSRFREEGAREPSVRRDSSRVVLDNSFDTPTRRSFSSSSDAPASRSSSISVVDSIADLRSKYSASNYVPAVIRNRDASRARASTTSIISDIGLPPHKVNVEPNRNHVTVVAAASATNASTNHPEHVDVDNMRPHGDTTTLTPTPSAAAATTADNDTNGNHAHHLTAAGATTVAPPGGVSVLEMTRKFERRCCAATAPTPAAVAVAATSSSATQTTRPVVGRRLAGGGGGGGGASVSTSGASGGSGGLKAESALTVTALAAKKGKTLLAGVSASANGSVSVAGGVASLTATSPTKGGIRGVGGVASSMQNGRHHVNEFSSYIPMECSASNEAEKPHTNGVKAQENGDCIKANKKCKDVNCTSPRLTRSPIASNGALGGASSARNSLERDGAHARGGGGASAVADSSSSAAATGGGGSYDRASPVKQMGLNGLKNIGNTCFMNSVVQCLSNTRPLLEYVKKDGYAADINTTLSSMKGALIKAFAQVIKELWSEDCSDRVVNTVTLKSQIQRFAPRFMGYSQQDAQEFLRYLLEGLHEDVNRVTSKPAPIHTEIDEKLSDNDKATESWQRYLRRDNSKIVDLFVGQFKSTLRCTHCGHCSVTFDPFWDLSLPIPQKTGAIRLSQCLDAFTREETLDGDEKPTCAKCKERRKCTKSFTIHKFPKILVIHLKRFSPTERFRGKLSVTVDFPFEGLDMSGYASETSNLQCRYNLYAVSNHSGTTYSGHYTAYCRHPYSQSWHEYNDSRVSSISSKSVVSGEAYVLFYEQDGKVSAHL